MNNWKLVNAETRAKTSPETFEIPDREARESLKPGNIVKLIFELQNSTDIAGERMWVEIIGKADNMYIGTLDNDPQFIKDLAAGDKIDFRPEHITEIWEG